MVGAGIFALLGEASAIAGSAVYISFIIGGIIALFSGYSLGKLGARYPSAGGIIEYLTQAYGAGTFVGSMGVMLFLAAVVSLSLIAKAFGNYAVSFLPTGYHTPVWHDVFTIGIIIVFVIINLQGARDVAFWERITVAIKFLVLSILSVAGLIYLHPDLLSPSHYPHANRVFFSLSITFFAYEGFRVISNAAEDMPNPVHTLPRAMMAAILLVMVLYVAISFAVFGNLPVDRVIQYKDLALAEAALPVFGKIGFTVVAITALIATASAINANLYAVTNITYQLAKDGELPAEFGKPIRHSREGLIVSGIFIILLSLMFDLTEIASIGSISLLFIHAVTHIGHLKIVSKTGASRFMLILAIIFSLGAMLLAVGYISRTSHTILLVLLSFVVISVVIEILLQKLYGREVSSRINQ